MPSCIPHSAEKLYRDFSEIGADMPDEEEDLSGNRFAASELFQSFSISHDETHRNAWAVQIVFDSKMRAAEAAALTSLMSSILSDAALVQESNMHSTHFDLFQLISTLD